MLKILIHLSLFIFILILPPKVYAWLDCPYGKINDVYPGLDNLYVDTNNNQVCDHSEPEVKKISFTLNQQIIDSIRFWLIFLPAVSYFIHWYFTSQTNLHKKSKIFSQATFRYIWNVILLILFIPTAVTSILLFLGNKSILLSQLHNLFGIVLVVILIFHLLLRLNYYLKLNC